MTVMGGVQWPSSRGSRGTIVDRPIAVIVLRVP